MGFFRLSFQVSLSSESHITYYFSFFFKCKHPDIISYLLYHSLSDFGNITITNFSSYHNLQNISPHSIALTFHKYTLSYLCWGVLAMFYFPDISRKSSSITISTPNDVACLLNLLLNILPVETI